MKFLNLDKRLIVALVGITIGGIGFGLLTPVTVILLEKSGASSFITGSATTVGYLSVVMFSWIAGRLIDKYGVKKILMTGILIWTLGSLGHIFWYNYTLLFFVRFITGVGGTFIFVGTEVIINVCSTEADRGKNIGLYAVLLSIGIAIGTLLIWTVSLGDYVPFLIGTVIMFAAYIFESIYLQEIDQFIDKKEREKLLMKDVPLMSLVTPFIYGIFESSIIVVIPLYGLRNNFTQSDVSFFLASFVIGGIILLYYLSKLSDSISKYKMLLYVSLVLSFVFAIPLTTLNFVILIAAFFILGGLVPSFYTVGLNFTIGSVDKKFISQANGYFVMMYGAGTLAGPILGAMLVDWNKQFGYWLFAIILCLVFFVTFSLIQSKKD